MIFYNTIEQGCYPPAAAFIKVILSLPLNVVVFQSGFGIITSFMATAIPLEVSIFISSRKEIRVVCSPSE